MKIALINENSQKNKNEFILKVLEKIASEYNHIVFNYGVSNDLETNIDYVGAGVLTGILLNAKAVDFVITGCSTGEGVLITANSLPNVSCGYVADIIDASLFMKINGGNAISIPFGKNFGVGCEINLESIFRTIFSTISKSGYPISRKQVQDEQRNNLERIQKLSKRKMIDILDEMDKDLLYNIIHNDYFEENFFANCLDDEIGEFLKDLIDN